MFNMAHKGIALLVTYTWTDNNDNQSDCRKVIQFPSEAEYRKDPEAFAKEAILQTLDIAHLEQLPAMPIITGNGVVVWVEDDSCIGSDDGIWTYEPDQAGYHLNGLIEHGKYTWSHFQVEEYPRQGKFEISYMSPEDQGDTDNMTTQDYYGPKPASVTVACTFDIPDDIRRLGHVGISQWLHEQLYEATYALPMNLKIYVG